MNNHNQYKKMAALVELIKKRPCGSAEELAEKLNISRRTFFRYVEILNDHGADICYYKSDNFYSIEENFCFFEDFLRSAL